MPQQKEPKRVSIVHIVQPLRSVQRLAAVQSSKVQEFKVTLGVGSSPVEIVEAVQLSNRFVYLILNPSSRLTGLLRRSLRGIGSAVDFDCW
jgi:hypothetical protein